MSEHKPKIDVDKKLDEKKKGQIPDEDLGGVGGGMAPTGPHQGGGTTSTNGGKDRIPAT